MGVLCRGSKVMLRVIPFFKTVIGADLYKRNWDDISYWLVTMNMASPRHGECTWEKPLTNHDPVDRTRWRVRVWPCQTWVMTTLECCLDPKLIPVDLKATRGELLFFIVLRRSCSSVTLFSGSQLFCIAYWLCISPTEFTTRGWGWRCLVWWAVLYSRTLHRSASSLHIAATKSFLWRYGVYLLDTGASTDHLSCNSHGRHGLQCHHRSEYGIRLWGHSVRLRLNLHFHTCKLFSSDGGASGKRFRPT